MVTLRTLEEIDAELANVEELLREQDTDAPCCAATTRPAAAVVRLLRKRIMQLRLDAATEAPREPLGGPMYPLAEAAAPGAKDFAALRREGARLLGRDSVHDSLRKRHKTGGRR